MNSWHDYFSQDAILPALGWLVAAIIGILGINKIWFPNARIRRALTIIIYASIMIGISLWYDYNGVQSLRSNKQTDRSIQTLLAISGLSSKGSSQGLDQLLTRNFKPGRITPTQEEQLARSFNVIKSSIPNPILVTYLNNSDWYPIAIPIQRALQRNGIGVSFEPQVALSPDETGLMFTMPDPTNPPEYALKLKDAFDIAGIRYVHFVKMLPNETYRKFTIFVGPPPLD